MFVCVGIWSDVADFYWTYISPLLTTTMYTYSDTAYESSLMYEVTVIVGLSYSHLYVCSMPVCIGMVHRCTRGLGGEGCPRGHRAVATVSSRGSLVAQWARGGSPKTRAVCCNIKYRLKVQQ